MVSLGLLIISYMGSSSYALGSPLTIHRRAISIGHWQLEIAQNSFSKARACRITNRHDRAVYLKGSVGFQFGKRNDVSGAVYKIDASEPMVARNHIPELIRLRVPFDRGGLGNSTGGIVWIPMRLLADARKLSIQPRHDKKPKTFNLHGLTALHVYSTYYGCSETDFVVE